MIRNASQPRVKPPRPGAFKDALRMVDPSNGDTI